jgi:N-acetylmuramoyl-L-alanine amidase
MKRLRGGLRDAVAAGLWCAVCCAGAAARPAGDAWQAANAARGKFEAAGSHSRAEYQGVMDGFRAIYHANPADAHAAAAVEQVAVLLAEQGRELHDAKALRDAAGQYEFLAKQYPASSLAAPALGAEVELFGPDGLGDAAEVRRVTVELKTKYPRSAAEVLAKAAVAPVPAAAKAPAGLSAASAKSADFGRDDKVVAGRADANAAISPLRPTASGRDDTFAEKGSAWKTAASPAPMARVTGIRHWSTASYTRVAIDLGDEVEYQAARVEHPDRIFFDLHHAHLAPELVGKSFAVTDDGFLTRIRAAQYSDDVTRVVLDVHEVTDYSAFLLPNPYRLIIDIHGKQPEAGARVQGSGVSDNQHSASSSDQHFASSNDPAPVVRQSADGVVSSLPPMPVTDGSSGFGLPPRTTSVSSSKDAKTAGVAPPRVVIPVKPTVAKPVPNTVVSRTGNTGTEVAEVSDQPGKVEATSKPTSGPISAKSPGAGRTAKVDLGTKGVAAPAVVAPPTADGETSLMRALGLKIGRIVIDAGHGGHDSGTLGADGIQEKDVVLDVALRLGKLLHQRMGAEIVYTRADDTFIPLETRTAIANKAQADLFISVHANSSPDASARGTEVYYLNFTSDPEAMRVASRENAVSTQSVHELSDLVKKIALKDKIEESKELATDVEDSLYKGLEKGNEGLKDRGVKKAPFVVLIGANMPSILAEISFVTNPDDAEQLLTPEYRQRVAESLFNGVARYAAGINGVKTPVVQRARVQGSGPRVQKANE